MSEIGCQHGWVLVVALFLAHRWLPSYCVLTCQRKKDSSLKKGFLFFNSTFDFLPDLKDKCIKNNYKSVIRPTIYKDAICNTNTKKRDQSLVGIEISCSIEVMLVSIQTRLV